MRNIKYVSLVAFIVFFLVCSIKSFGGERGFDPGSEPDGFRGIKWGADISTFKDMEFVKDIASEEYYGKEKNYKRKGDIRKIGSAKLIDINYNFWDGKFHAVMANIKGIDNWKLLRQVCFKMFGMLKIEKSFNGEVYIWKGEHTNASLYYDYTRNMGTLLLLANSFSNDMKVFKKQMMKEKEGL